MGFHLGHPPEAPLDGFGTPVRRRRLERAFAVLFGQVQVYRHRFPQDDAVVLENGDMTIGVELQMFGAFGLGHFERVVLILDAEFFERPQRAGGARLGRTVQLKHLSYLPAGFTGSSSYLARAACEVQTDLVKRKRHHTRGTLIRKNMAERGMKPCGSVAGKCGGWKAFFG